VSSLQKISFFFLIIITIAGCTTPPQTSNYYLIESTAQQSQLNSDQQISLLPIQLSDYLNHVLANFDTSNHCAKIKIQLDELSPSNTGDVTTNGRWFIHSENKTLRTNKFSFTGRIDSDGFSNSNLVLQGT